MSYLIILLKYFSFGPIAEMPRKARFCRAECSSTLECSIVHRRETIDMLVFVAAIVRDRFDSVHAKHLPAGMKDIGTLFCAICDVAVRTLNREVRDLVAQRP